MKLRAAVSRRGRTATLVALALAGLVIGLLSGIALATDGSGATTTLLSPRPFDDIKNKIRTGSHQVRIKAKGISDVYVVDNRIAPGSHAGWHTHPGPGLIAVKSGTSRHVPSFRSAGRFLLTVVEQKVGGDWAKAWQSLYPLHQRIAPRDTFIRCETATPFSAPLKSIHVIHVRAAPVQVAGVLRPVPGVAVMVAVKLRWYGPRDPITFTHTFHLLPVQGHWRWILSPDRYRLYRQDACFARLAI